RTAATQPRAFVVGQLLAPIVLRPGKRIDTWGIRFRPGGAAAFFETPMPDLAGRMVDLESLCRDVERDGIDAVLQAGGTAERRWLLERWLLERLGRRAADPLPQVAARAIVAARGRVRVDELATRAGLGARQFERRFLQGVGIPPRALARLARFQHL